VRQSRNRLYHLKREEDGKVNAFLIGMVLIVLLIVGAMIAVWPHDDGIKIARISCEVMPISNVEYSGNVIFLINADQNGRAQLNITVTDFDDNGVKSAAVEVSGPGFLKMTNTTNRFGRAYFVIDFRLLSSDGDHITMKASGGQSGLGGSAILRIFVQAM